MLPKKKKSHKTEQFAHVNLLPFHKYFTGLQCQYDLDICVSMAWLNPWLIYLQAQRFSYLKSEVLPYHDREPNIASDPKCVSLLLIPAHFFIYISHSPLWSIVAHCLHHASLLSEKTLLRMFGTHIQCSFWSTSISECTVILTILIVNYAVSQWANLSSHLHCFRISWGFHCGCAVVFWCHECNLKK